MRPGLRNGVRLRCPRCRRLRYLYRSYMMRGAVYCRRRCQVSPGRAVGIDLEACHGI